MDIKQINYFISVANHGSLSAASQSQNISVQALSKSISDLEQSLNEPLFLRTYRGMVLTPFGEQFYQQALQVSCNFHTLETFTFEQGKKRNAYKMMLCAPPFIRNEKALENISSYFSSRLPFNIDVSIGTGQVGIDALQRRGVDALITIGTYTGHNVDCIPIGTLPTGICMNINHPLAHQTSVNLKDLEEYPILSSKSFDHFNESILTMYKNETKGFTIIEPDQEEKENESSLLRSALYQNNAICFVVFLPVLGKLAPQTITIPIDSNEAKPVSICLIVRSGEDVALPNQIREFFGSLAL